jgi:hypothetical protein
VAICAMIASCSQSMFCPFQYGLRVTGPFDVFKQVNPSLFQSKIPDYPPI